MYDLFASVRGDVSCTRQALLFSAVFLAFISTVPDTYRRRSGTLRSEWVGTDSEGFLVNTCDTKQTFLKTNRNPVLWKPGGTHCEEAGVLYRIDHITVGP